MNVISEKVIYETEVYEKFANIDAEGILWGEDLYDTKMVVFSGKIKSIRGLYKRDLIKVAIVYFDFRQVLYIKSMAVKFNCNTQTSYIEKEQFNIMWKHLRKSVELGIRLHRENGEHVPINIPEDIVDLSLLQRKGRLAKIKNGKIIYTAAEISKETKKAQGRKQSLLDNREYNFFYDVNENIFHDRDCEAIKYITPDNFMAETKIPEGLKNSITRYHMEKEDIVGMCNESESYHDLLEVVIVRRGAEVIDCILGYMTFQLIEIHDGNGKGK